MKARKWTRVALVAVLAGTVLLTACGGQPAPSTSQAPGSEPAATSQPQQQASPPAASADQAWQQLQAAAKAEGKVVVQGPGIPPLRQGIVEGFQAAFGINVEYLSMPTGELLARVDREAAAGQVSIDAMVGGVSNCWYMSEKGQIADFRDVLVAPGLLDPTIWRDGKPRFNPGGPSSPPDFVCSLQTTEYAMTDIFINPTVIEPDAIKSWHDLLKPEYKGKIVANDPRNPGPGQPVAIAIYRDLGKDYFENLYIGQEVTLSTDHRQLAEWVARGVYPIGLGLVQSAVEPLRSQGLPLQRIYPADGVDTVTGGFSAVMLLNNSPNPNAARLFANWFAGKEAQEMWESVMMETSLRTDTSRKGVPDYVFPRPGVNYVNEYDRDYFFDFRVGAVEEIQNILGR